MKSTKIKVGQKKLRVFQVATDGRGGTKLTERVHTLSESESPGKSAHESPRKKRKRDDSPSSRPNDPNLDFELGSTQWEDLQDGIDPEGGRRTKVFKLDHANLPNPV